MSAYLTVEFWAAKEFGFAAAAVLAQAILWGDWCAKYKKNPKDGYYWCKHTNGQWIEDLEGSISVRTVRRALDDLTASGLLVIRRDADNTTYYRVDQNLYYARRGSKPTPPSGQNGHSPTLAKLARPSGQIGTAPQSLEKEKEESKESLATYADAPAADPVPSSPDSPLPKTGTKRLERTRSPEKPAENTTLPDVPVKVIPAPRRPKNPLPRPLQERTPGSQVWEAYCDAYEQTYGVRPAWNKETRRHSKVLAESMLLEEAIAVAAFYLTVKSQWYVLKQHDIRWAAQDANALRTQMLSGRRITSLGAKQIERHQETREQILRVTAQMNRDELEKGDSPW